MSKRRFLLHLVAWPILVLIIVAGQSRVEAIAAAEPAGEVRSVPVYVQSRPVYQKPSPKPKLVLAKHPPQPVTSPNSNAKNNDNPNLVTQTVYGFLDFVTTIGNTVMVFTPQTKKVEQVKPTVISATATKDETPVVATAVVDVATEKSTSISSSSSSSRQPKLILIEDPIPSSAEEDHEIPLIESSEYEPHIFATSANPASYLSSSSLASSRTSQLEYVNLMSDALLNQQQHHHDDLEAHHDQSGAASTFSSVFQVFNNPVLPVAADEPSFVTPEVQVRSQVNVISDVKSVSEPPPTASKGFTLKFSKPSQSASFSPSSARVSLPKLAKPTPAQPKKQPENPEEPTGLINQIFETKVSDGVTTVHETKILGTYIGTQYARVLESSSTVLPVITASKAPTPLATPPQLPKLKFPKPQALHIVEKSTTPKSAEQDPIEHREVQTAKSVVSSSNDDFDDDERFNEDPHYDDVFAEPSSSVIVEPTPTASEEQTLYVLPQKEPKAELYASPVPNQNAYSRQPQFYVDIAPAKSVDFIVTATPSRNKFRQSGKPSTNRFSNRFNNRGSSSSSTESNELTLAAASQSQETSPEDTSSRRSPSRFRSRNRSSGARSNEAEVLPTVSVYSKTISSTPSRRFASSNSRTRSSGKSNEKNYGQEQISSFKPSRNFGAAAAATRQIQATTSTSIYRFKLNRPTGRWRFKPSPKPKVNIIKTKDDDELTTQASSNSQQSTQPLAQQPSGPVYLQNFGGDNPGGDLQDFQESRTESNELVQDIEPELVPQTIRVATITPSEFSDLDKFLEIATIRSPYVFQAGNVKNTRYITLTKTFTKEHIQPTQASLAEATLEDILATKPPYEKILEGSNDVATLPVIVLGGDQATPPLETVTQTFSTTQLMLKTSILPVLYDGVTTLYTLTQSYFVTRLVTAHKTVPPIELFQFVPTKALNEFNTALQEAGSENREHLVPSESENDENDANYEHILAPPDELTLVGSDFDPSSMDDKIPKGPSGGSGKGGKSINNVKTSKSGDAAPGQQQSPAQPQVPSELAGLSPEQLAFLRYFNQAPTGNSFFPPPLHPSQPQFEVTSSPVIVDTTTTIVESKTLRILFGAKPTQTTLFSTRVVPTRVTTYVTASVPVKSTAAIPNFYQPAPFPLAYVG